MDEVPVKSVVIDGVKYISVRRPTESETDISCRRCAFYGKNVFEFRHVWCKVNTIVVCLFISALSPLPRRAFSGATLRGKMKVRPSQ